MSRALFGSGRVSWSCQLESSSLRNSRVFWKEQLKASLASSMYQFPRATLRKEPKLGAQNNRRVLPHSSGGYKSEVTVSGGHPPSEPWRGESSLASSSLWCLLAIFCTLQLVEASVQSLPALSPVCLRCVSIFTWPCTLCVCPVISDERLTPPW